MSRRTLFWVCRRCYAPERNATQGRLRVVATEEETCDLCQRTDRCRGFSEVPARDRRLVVASGVTVAIVAAVLCWHFLIEKRYGAEDDRKARQDPRNHYAR